MIVFHCALAKTTIAGGLRTLYRHAELLAGMGQQTLAVAPDGPPASFATSTPTFRSGCLDLKPDDHIVFPEAIGADDGIGLNLLRHPGPKHVFVQNHFYMHMGIRIAPRWREMGITRVFASSRTIADYLQDCLGFADPAVVPYGIDTDLYRPRPKALRIAVMPRKLRREFEFIRETFAAAYPDLAGVPWEVIDGRTEAEVAELLGGSAVFLSLSHQEGFGLPPLEAMACGCVVAGLHGVGGLEYASAANGFWYGYDQQIDCVHGLATAVKMAAANGDRHRAMVQAGFDTVARYSVERTRQALAAYFGVAR